MTSLAAQSLFVGAILAGIVAVIALLVWAHIRWAALWPAQSEYHGITVGVAKFYDNRSLSLMLEQLREQLRTLQTLDSNKISAGIGTLQVEETKETSVSAGAGKAEEKSDSNSPAGKSGEAAPSRLSERALDLLADQVNLSYDIFNLRLMLERAISDRIVTNDQGDSESRVQAVVGFPISIDPRAFSAGCAAIVEVELSAEKPLSLVALFPQEETHNASILSSSRVNLSGSAKASGVPINAQYQQNQSINAIRRESDTVALERPSDDDTKVRFAWEFRPTSGCPSVAPGSRLMLAVISIEEPDKRPDIKDLSARDYVKVSVQVRSYWRRFHMVTQTLSNWSGWRVLLTRAPTETKWEDRQPIKALISHAIEEGLAAEVDDNIQWYLAGDQTAVVIVPGANFFTGTSVIIGDKILDRPENGLVIKSERSLQITIPVSALTHEAVLNARYGPSVPLMMDPVKKYGLRPFSIGNAELVQLSAGEGYRVKLVLVSATIEDVKRLPSPLLEINGRFATATLDISPGPDNSVRLSARVGAEFVKNTSGTLFRLTFPFLGKDWSLQFHTYDPRDALWAIRCVDGTTSRLQFSGGFFDSEIPVPWSVLLDKEYKIDPENKGPLKVVAPDLLELEVPTEIADKYDQAFLIGPFGSGPVSILRDQSKATALQPGAKTLVVGANSQTTVEIGGSYLSTIKQVRLGEKDLPFAVDSEGTKITAGLFGDALRAPGKYEITLVTGTKDPLKVPLFVTAANPGG